MLKYIQRVKVETAKHLLESLHETVSEVMYAVGYSDTKSFRTVFKDVTGLSPTDYRAKYSHEATLVSE